MTFLASGGCRRRGYLRAKMRRTRTLKLSGQKVVAQAFTVEQKAALLAAAKARRSKVIYPALMLALHAGMRDAEVRGLQWGRVDLERAIVTVGNRHWLDVQFRCDLPRYRRVIMPYDLVFARSLVL